MGHRWRGHEHPELYNMINSGPGPAASDPQTEYWLRLTEDLSQVDADLHKSLSDLKVTWQGQAADSAQGGLTPLKEWATDAEQGSTVMRISTENQAEYISTARAEMPEPVAVTTPAPSGWQVAVAGVAAATGNPGPAAAVAMQAVDHEIQEAAQSAAEQKAVDTMVNYETSSVWNRNTLGTFVPPPDVVVSTPPPRGSEVGGVVGGFTSGMTYTDPTGSTAPSGYSPPALNSPSTPPSGPSGGPAYPGPSGGGPTPIPSSPTAPSGTGPYPPPGPGTGPGYPPGPGGGPTPYPPSGPPGPIVGPGQPSTGPGLSQNSPGKPGALPGSGPSGGSGSQQLGRGGIGGPGGLGGLGAAGLNGDGSRAASQLGKGGPVGIGSQGVIGGRPVAGAGARGGVGGAMGAGGRRGEGDEDGEHFAPDYLMETDDVFGDERMVSPQVIGENPQR